MENIKNLPFQKMTILLFAVTYMKYSGYGVNKSQTDKKISSMPIIFQSNHQTKFSCQPEFKASDKVNSYFLPAIIFVLLSIRDGSIK